MTHAKTELLYSNDPIESALRMQCKKCGAAPGQKCKDARGKEMGVLFHDARNADYKLLVELLAKMEQWNTSYGKDKTK